MQDVQPHYSIDESIGSLVEKIKLLDSNYTHMILLVGLAGSRKTQLLKTLLSTDQNRFSYSNINLVLSKKLLNLSVRERQCKFFQIFQEFISNTKGKILLLDNTEILFDNYLNQDPLKCLTLISRQRKIIASWNGSYSNNSLTYGNRTHPEFKEYKRQNIDAVIQTI